MDISGSWICFHSVFGFRQNCRSYLIYRLEIWQKLLLIKARSIAALTKQYTLRTLQHFKESHLLWISVLERQEGDHCVFMFSSLSSNNAHWAVCVLLHISPRFDLCCSYSRTTLSRSVTFFQWDIFANNMGCSRQVFKTFTCRPLFGPIVLSQTCMIGLMLWCQFGWCSLFLATDQEIGKKSHLMKRHFSLK